MYTVLPTENNSKHSSSLTALEAISLLPRACLPQVPSVAKPMLLPLPATSVALPLLWPTCHPILWTLSSKLPHFLHFHSKHVKTDPSLLPEYCWAPSWPPYLLSCPVPSLAILFILFIQQYPLKSPQPPGQMFLVAPHHLHTPPYNLAIKVPFRPYCPLLKVHTPAPDPSLHPALAHTGPLPEPLLYSILQGSTLLYPQASPDCRIYEETIS